MSHLTGRPGQVPWMDSPAFGVEFVHNPRTDEIVLKNGRRFARPHHMPAENFEAASYDGPLPFEYTGSPPGPSNNPMLGGNRPQQSLPDRPGPAGQISGALMSRQPQPPHVLQQIPPNRELQVVFNARTSSQIERREPVRSYAPASNVQGITIGHENATSTLFPEFKIRPGRFFVVGRVFLVLWSEPAGGHSVVTKWEPGITLNRFNERVYSKVRRFVVIREGPGTSSCSALPINTYSGQGVAKRGVNKSEHCIIYSTRVAPAPRRNELPTQRNEDGMRGVSIRVDPDSPADQLDEMSRLNLAGVTNVQHNIKVRSHGRVNDRSLRDLLQQFDNVWARQPFPTPTRAPIVYPIPSQDDDEESDDDDDDNDDDDEEDDEEWDEENVGDTGADRALK